MKVAFVSQPGYKVLPAAGSLELWTAEVARRLAERHEVTIYASGQSDDSAYADGVAYRLLSHGCGAQVFRGIRFLYRALPSDRAYFSSAMYPLAYWTRVGRALRRSRPDVVHLFNYSQAIPILRRFSPSSRFVLHMQCEWLNQLDRRMIARRLRRTDLVFGCSDHITLKIVDRFPEHADRCRTIYNGVDVHAAGDRAYPDRPRPLKLLNIGRVSPEKGLHVLVDAFVELVRDFPELELTIVGDEAVVPFEMAVAIDEDPLVRALARFYGGEYGAWLRERLGEAASRVSFAGRVEHDELDGFYAEADIFVYPSLFESFAIPPVEAMTVGIPVVASRVGGMKETIVHEETGLLIEREDPAALAAALRRLIEDADLRRSFGRAGRERAALFAWPRIVGEVEAAFAGLVEQAPLRAQPELGLAGIE